MAASGGHLRRCVIDRRYYSWRARRSSWKKQTSCLGNHCSTLRLKRLVVRKAKWRWQAILPWRQVERPLFRWRANLSKRSKDWRLCCSFHSSWTYDHWHNRLKKFDSFWRSNPTKNHSWRTVRRVLLSAVGRCSWRRKRDQDESRISWGKGCTCFA